MAFQEKYRKLELKHRRTYHLKSKGEKLLQAPSLAYQQSTYEATRGPQWTQQILARRARNDRAEGVLLGGFEGLDSYDELPADVVLPVLSLAHSRALSVSAVFRILAVFLMALLTASDRMAGCI